MARTDIQEMSNEALLLKLIELREGIMAAADRQDVESCTRLLEVAGPYSVEQLRRDEED